MALRKSEEQTWFLRKRFPYNHICVSMLINIKDIVGGKVWVQTGGKTLPEPAAPPASQLNKDSL